MSSLHDWMNLVAKEFVAARDDDAGVLILSQFTGAAREMTGALIVNAIIVQGIENALKAGRAPEIYISSNSNGDDHNDVLLQKYKSKIRHL